MVYGKEKFVANRVKMSILKMIGNEKMELSEGGGFWTKYLHFENKVFWKRDDIVKKWDHYKV